MIIKEFPNCENSFLRYQVGIAETRHAMIPVYTTGIVGRKLEYYAPSKERVTVFRLLGFSSSFERAEAMARQRANRLGITLSSK